MLHTMCCATAKGGSNSKWQNKQNLGFVLFKQPQNDYHNHAKL